MAWQPELLTLVRVLVNDLSNDPIYSDDQILQSIVVSASYVQFDVVLDRKYAIDISNISISPDPTSGTRDDIFISLLGLRTACLLDQSTFRTKAALEGIRAALGPANLAVQNHLAGFKQILEHGPCKLYYDLTEHWDLQNATAVAAILSPFVGNNFDPFVFPYSDHRNKNFYA
jgi:hypothetical protein